MPQDPLEEWRRLTALYSEMGDIEIQELAGQINDLTPTAQQILRDEMKKRQAVESQSHSHREVFEGASGEDDEEQRLDPSIYPPGGGGKIDYSWKVSLCPCESYLAARQLCEMLRRAKIDSWLDRSGSNPAIPWENLGSGELQVLVGADQLDQARAIAAQPIPQDIIDQMKKEDSTPDYEIPVCPKCKAEDPTLESVEPSNNWLCESCGYTWSDPLPGADQPASTPHS